MLILENIKPPFRSRSRKENLYATELTGIGNYLDVLGTWSQFLADENHDVYVPGPSAWKWECQIRGVCAVRMEVLETPQT